MKREKRAYIIRKEDIVRYAMCGAVGSSWSHMLVPLPLPRTRLR